MANNAKHPIEEQPLVAHLIELRDRLLRAILAVLVIFLALVSFSRDLYTLLAKPLMAHLPEGTSMIATEVASPFLTPFKLTLVLSILLAMPYLLYQLWLFVAPGLYDSERKLVYPLMMSSTILFYGGVLFAYFVVFPVVFGFFTSVAPEGVSVMTDIAKYLDFVLKMFFAFGLAFEVPVATILLVRMGITTPEDLGAKRPYIIVGAFVLAMLLTPPDVISQSLLALPVLLLFELGLYFSRRFVPESEPDPDPEDAAVPDDDEVAPEEGDVGDEATDVPYSEDDWEAEFDRAEADEAGLDDEPPADDESDDDEPDRR